MMHGTIGILNVGTGDTKISFDPENPAERERAAKIVTDMLRRGYAILIQIGIQDGEPIYKRARDFDPKTCEYVVFASPEELGTAAAAAKQETKPRKNAGRKGRRLGPYKIAHRLKAEKVTGIAVARSAGG